MVNLSKVRLGVLLLKTWLFTKVCITLSTVEISFCMQAQTLHLLILLAQNAFLSNDHKELEGDQAPDNSGTRIFSQRK